MSLRTTETRPYTLTESDYMRLLHAQRAARFIEYLADAAKEQETIEIELVASVMHQLAGDLEKTLISMENEGDGA